ncbi:MAG: SGNH/GDSL hydrolase family protein [Clostridia bacterium]|nr:SGNH/GDSL hydrolase family protein [Clostridia bacterium]
MKILFFGDSITDMGRNRTDNTPSHIFAYGSGYPMFVAGELYSKDPTRYEVINRGISGNKTVDLYARLKADVWNLEPDVLSILIGVNDLWHELDYGIGVEPARFEKVYSAIIEETQERLPGVKIVLMEPFILPGKVTAERLSRFEEIYDYARVVKRLAEKYSLEFLPLQSVLNEAAAKHGAEHYLYDGIHPMVAGAALIAREWTKLFYESIEMKR